LHFISNFGFIVYMAKQSAYDIAKQLKKQNDDAYGDDYVDGDHDKFDDTKEMLEDAIGNAPREGESFLIDDEIDKDENDQEKILPEDLDAEDILADHSDDDSVVSLDDLESDDDNFDDYEE